jgi:hypothetical protein
MNARAARVALAAFALLLVVAAGASRAQAQSQSLRAWLDRDRVALGETATLNIEVDGRDAAEPDYSP